MQGGIAVTGQLDRIEWKLDMLLAMWRGQEFGGDAPEDLLLVASGRPPQSTGGGGGLASVDTDVLGRLRGMSMKQHGTLQMVLRGASNQEIADRFGVSVNTAKVYVRSIAGRLGVHLRTQIVATAVQAIRDMPDAEYRKISRGLPKDWDETWNYADRRDDPWWPFYTGSRVRGEALSEEDEG
jgi:DNA-binding CsgD family transcriptional regulator